MNENETINVLESMKLVLSANLIIKEKLTEIDVANTVEAIRKIDILLKKYKELLQGGETK